MMSINTKQHTWKKHDFSKINYVERNLKLHKGENPYQCTQSDKYFSIIGDLENHLKRHIGKMSYQCNANICNVKMLSSNGDMYHDLVFKHF